MTPNKPQRKQLRILNINFHSVKKMGKQLEAIIDATNPDIILGTGTWSNPNIKSAEIFPDYIGYVVRRRDRKGEVGGGVLIAAKSHLELTNIKQSKNIELISRTITLSKTKNST